MLNINVPPIAASLSLTSGRSNIFLTEYEFLTGTPIVLPRLRNIPEKGCSATISEVTADESTLLSSLDSPKSSVTDTVPSSSVIAEFCSIV